jgi:hypothetical protein
MKPKNPAVFTESLLIVKHVETGATRKVGAILKDTNTDKRFVLIDSAVDFTKFRDERYDSDFVKLQIVCPKEGYDE